MRGITIMIIPCSVPTTLPLFSCRKARGRASSPAHLLLSHVYLVGGIGITSNIELRPRRNIPTTPQPTLFLGLINTLSLSIRPVSIATRTPSRTRRLSHRVLLTIDNYARVAPFATRHLPILPVPTSVSAPHRLDCSSSHSLSFFTTRPVDPPVLDLRLRAHQLNSPLQLFFFLVSLQTRYASRSGRAPNERREERFFLCRFYKLYRVAIRSGTRIGTCERTLSSQQLIHSIVSTLLRSRSTAIHT